MGGAVFSDIAWNASGLPDGDLRPGEGLFMNKAITDGIVLMPLPFAAGLSVWSSGNGTPGSDTYAGSGTGVFVSADQDFGGCLEVQKTDNTQKVRYMAETPILPGCYLQITARVKAIAGPLPNVRIAGWAGAAGGGAATVATSVGPATALSTYGEVVEISAIVGTGDRNGVDLIWPTAAYGHFGIDLTGNSGGLVRVDDIQIVDITSAFQRDMMAMVDVRDYGALGDGTTDDSDAFEAADAAADGREILVPAGVFRLTKNVTIENRIRFEGTISQTRGKRFVLQKDYNYQAYVDAFGDEEEAFKKAYQALINFTDHESLDLCGRRVSLTEPLDMQACDPDRTSFATRRVIRNGQFEPVAGNAWDERTVTSQATYNPSTNEKRLTNVVNVANVEVGALLVGSGVGREVYVTSVNVGAGTVTISQPLFDAAGTQNFTFKRFAYLLDFSGYDSLSQFILDDIEFQCSDICSGIMLAPDGLTFHVRDCFINNPKDRGLTSPGRGCQGMLIDRCQLISSEEPIPVQSRTSIGLNANANDVKLRDNRVSKFKHFCVLAGTGNIISGNHYFHGDNETDGVRRGGLILTSPNCATLVTSNYIDNNFLEWTNEHESEPEFANQFSFGGLTMTGNIFIATNVASGFSFLVVKPFGPDHFIHGLAVIGNAFRVFNGNINRVDKIDTTYSDLNFDRMRTITFSGNSFHGINQPVFNPAHLEHTQNTTSKNWVADTEPMLPFKGRARFIDAAVPSGAITNGSGNQIFEQPWADNNYGNDQRQVRFVWNTSVKGKLRYTVRMDNPV